MYGRKERKEETTHRSWLKNGKTASKRKQKKKKHIKNTKHTPPKKKNKTKHTQKPKDRRKKKYGTRKEDGSWRGPPSTGKSSLTRSRKDRCVHESRFIGLSCRSKSGGANVRGNKQPYGKMRTKKKEHVKGRKRMPDGKHGKHMKDQ